MEKTTGLDRHMQACKETMEELIAVYDHREESNELWPTMLRLTKRLELLAHIFRNEIDNAMTFTDILNLYAEDEASQ